MIIVCYVICSDSVSAIIPPNEPGKLNSKWPPQSSASTQSAPVTKAVSPAPFSSSPTPPSAASTAPVVSPATTPKVTSSDSPAEKSDVPKVVAKVNKTWPPQTSASAAGSIDVSTSKEKTETKPKAVWPPAGESATKPVAVMGSRRAPSPPPLPDLPPNDTSDLPEGVPPALPGAAGSSSTQVATKKKFTRRTSGKCSDMNAMIVQYAYVRTL